MADLEPGTQLGNYRIENRLGKGGMGTVYRATDTKLGRQVALKMLPVEHLSSEERRKRFEREARILAALNHNNVATLFGFEEHGGVPFLIMELVSGPTLAERFTEGPMSAQEALPLFRQIAAGTAAAHEVGIVHRDLKPANILIDARGQVKVVDFGLSATPRPSESSVPGSETWTRLTRTHQVMGTRAYMAPEVLTGKPADERSDVYAIGLMLDQVLEWQDPEAADSDPANRALRYLARRCTETRPEARPASAAVLESELETLAAPTETWSATSGPHSALEPPSRGVRNLLIAALVVVMVTVATIAYRTYVGGGPQPRAVSQVLVTDPDNRTGQPVFDLALKRAFEADLDQSRTVRTIDATRVREALRYLRRPLDAELDTETARMVGRFLQLDLLLIPEVHALGDDLFDVYLLLMDPETGTVHERLRTSVEGREQVLLKAVDHLSGLARRSIGETRREISSRDRPVSLVTTASLEALESLTLGRKARQRREFENARSYFERALDQDPDFVSARTELGILLIQDLDDAQRGKELISEALGLADTVSEREALRIEALARQFVDEDLEAAIRSYERLLEIYPEDDTARNNLGVIYQRLGQPLRAASYYRAELETSAPRYFTGINLWWLELNHLLDPAASEKTARRMLELSDDADNRHRLAWSLFAEGRLRQAEQWMRRTLELQQDHRFASYNLAHLLYKQGAYDEALAKYELLFEFNDRDDPPFDLSLYRVLAMAKTGRSDEVPDVLHQIEQQLQAAEREHGSMQLLDVNRALLFAARGETDDAVALLEKHRDQPEETWVLFRMAEGYALLEQATDACELLDRAYRSGYEDRYFATILPTFDRIADRRVFRALLEAVPRV